MLVAEKYEQFVLGETKISQDAIAKARNDYRYQYARTPQLLRLHHAAYRDLLVELDHRFYDMKTVQGLEIVPDPTLGENEWRVGCSEEKVYEK
jgi:hypothetical protein